MNLLQLSLTGGAAFREVDALLSGLTLAQASQPGTPYTLAELLAHLRVTMRASLDLVTGQAQEWPEGLDVWPLPPVQESEWNALLSDLRLMLAEASALAGDPSSRARDLLTDLAVHNAYHWGQVALLRRQAGAEFE
ncbi:MAG: damage-inducible protein DinB [Deinococcus sp.]|uniref:damage-inducible protein DinB n=1 Tax=Deinococcus sp. TaxID=47478 RepID=UPI0026DC839C|nr:damage-inducible protein DinB [Deinococcus sp.]MDO4246123.1 damage-inducible protein DinB [Deinococcus sp.]